jgi:hypothetical protein
MVVLVWNSLLSILDIPCFIAAGILPFLFVSTVFGFRKMKSAFLISREKEPEKDSVMQALYFFRIYGKATWIAGLIALIIGVIGTLNNLEDKSVLGPNLAVALIPLLYSGIINMAIIMPFTVFAKEHIKE